MKNTRQDAHEQALTEFVSLAVHALRLHRLCGDVYPEDGWPEANVALAAYARLKRSRRTARELRRGKSNAKALLALIEAWQAVDLGDEQPFDASEIEPLQLREWKP